MKLHFAPDQSYQHEAIRSVTDNFEEQDLMKEEGFSLTVFRKSLHIQLSWSHYLTTSCIIGTTKQVPQEHDFNNRGFQPTVVISVPNQVTQGRNNVINSAVPAGLCESRCLGRRLKPTVINVLSLRDINLQIEKHMCRSYYTSEMLVKITLPEDNRRIFASKYQTVLPSKETLQKLMRRQGGV